MTGSLQDQAIGDVLVAVQNAQVASILVPKPGGGSRQDAIAEAEAEVYAAVGRARALGVSDAALVEAVPGVRPYLGQPTP